MNRIKTTIFLIMLLLCNYGFSQNKISQKNYKKLLFNSYPTYNMIVGIDENKFVVPMVTRKKEALLESLTYELDPVYTTPFNLPLNSKNDPSPLITSYNRESKNLFALRQLASGKTYNIEYLKINPSSGETISQKLLLADQNGSSVYYFSENKKYFVIIPLMSKNDKYTYILYDHTGNLISNNTIAIKNGLSLFDFSNQIIVSDNGDVIINTGIEKSQFSIDVYDSNSIKLSSFLLTNKSKGGEISEVKLIFTGTKKVVATAMITGKKSCQIEQWLLDFTNESIKDLNIFDITTEKIEKYYSLLDESQILNNKKLKVPKHIDKLKIVNTHFADNQVVTILESYKFNMYKGGNTGSDYSFVYSNGTYIFSTKISGGLNWAVMLPREIDQKISKYRTFGYMGETVKAKTEVMDGVLKLITSEDFSRKEYGYDVYREIDLITGKVSHPQRLQSKDDIVYKYSFYDYYKWISPDEVIMMVSIGYDFKLIKIKVN